MNVCSPVGVPYKAHGEATQVGDWHETNWRDAFYYLGQTATSQGIPTIHTGSDLVLVGVSCANKPVYAMLAGVVTYAQIVEHTTWGWLVVIQHGPDLYSRYAHFAQCYVHIGQIVVTGQQIGTIGNAFGQLPYHLHVDVSNTDLLGSQPRNWPGLDKTMIDANYLDVLTWLRSNTMTNTPLPVTNPDTATAARTVAASLPPDSKVTVIFNGVPVQEPIGVVTAFQVDLADLATIVPKVVPPTPTPTPTPEPTPTSVTLYVTANIGLRTHTGATVVAQSLGSLAYRQAVQVDPTIVSGTDENGAPAPWYKIVTGTGTNGADLKGMYAIAKYLSATIPPA